MKKQDLSEVIERARIHLEIEFNIEFQFTVPIGYDLLRKDNDHVLFVDTIRSLGNEFHGIVYVTEMEEDNPIWRAHIIRLEESIFKLILVRAELDYSLGNGQSPEKKTVWNILRGEYPRIFDSEDQSYFTDVLCEMGRSV